jgi:hypothetical protein
VEINGVAHVVLRANRYEECILLRPADGGGRPAGRSPRRQLRLLRRRPDRAPDPAGAAGLDHLCFRARSRQDVDELYPLLQSIGADVIRAPEEGPWAPG